MKEKGKDRLKDMTLKQKLNMYQRNSMVSGLMQPGTDKNQETKQILENIGNYSMGLNPTEDRNKSR